MAQERQFGEKYSEAYDSLYREKDYRQESDFLQEVMRKFSPIEVKRILSFGCGTCTPDILLARAGYRVHGVDLSEKMLDIAREKIEAVGLIDNLTVEQGDITNFTIDEKFDFAMAMFNVAGYWRTNRDMDGVLKSANESLKKGGLFVFDCWYEAAVLADKPGDRVKVVEEDGRRIIRLTQADLDVNRNIITINFHVFTLEGDRVVSETQETHPARYWSIPELEYFLEKNGFDTINVSLPLNLDEKPSEDNWNMFVVAQKR